MKILGFEITKGSAKTSSSIVVNSGKVSIQENLQKTAPSRPLKSSSPTQEAGDSGTRLIHGIITEEYNPQLQGIEGVKIFDQMRKSDATVRAAMLVTTLPIRRAKWFINPATDSDKDKEIANFVEHALFDWIEDMTWDDVIRQALLMAAFGVMLFEKVYGTKDHDGKTYVTIKKLAPRLPKSILMWELVDRTFGIQQIRQDGVLAQIPGSKLLIFVNEREGDNWWGTSMLRAAYKHWYYKDNFYKIEAIGFERQAVGVPIIKMPPGYTETDEKKATTAAQNMRTNEGAYMLLPPGYEFEFADMKAASLLKPETSIEHHNKEILQSVLAQFLELGATKSGSGSRALSQDHSDLFLKAEEALANTIRDVFNKNLLPELIDMNFNDVTVYPVLDYSGISKIDVTALGTAYSQLVTAGALNPTNDDQQYLRAAMGLPPRTQADIDEMADDEPSSEELEDNVDIEDDGGENPSGKGEVDNAAGETAKPKPTAKENKKTTDATATKKKAHSHSHAHKFGEAFTPWRKLTFAEQKVSFSNLQKTMDEMEAALTTAAKELLNKAKDDFMAKLHAAIDDGDTKAISALEIKFVSDYKTMLKTAMKDAYEYGKNNASTEMGVEVPASVADSIANMDMVADTIATQAATSIETKAKLMAANALTDEATALQAAGEIDTTLEATISTSVDDTAGILIAQNMNIGRNDVFQKNIGMIASLQRSELLDSRTCNFCLSMDGLVIEPDSDWATKTIFHTNCRGIWVEILKDEENPPEVTDVPENVSDYFGGQPNELIQPPKPIVRPDSPASEEVARRQAVKDAKKK